MKSSNFFDRTGRAALLLAAWYTAGCTLQETNDPSNLLHGPFAARSETGLDGPDSLLRARPPRVDGMGGDVRDLAGHWYLDRDKTRLLLTVGSLGGRLIGSVSLEGAARSSMPIIDPIWDGSSGFLRFRVMEDGTWYWYAIDVTAGVMAGRYATMANDATPSESTAFAGHVTGWRRETFDAEIVPRVYDITVDADRLLRLRIDRSQSGPLEFVGELKVVAKSLKDGDGDRPAQQIVVSRWDGRNMAFTAPGEDGSLLFNGVVDGRTIEGTIIEEGAHRPSTFSGVRADILNYGSRVKSTEERSAWQTRARQSLFRLMMAGNPMPTFTDVTIADRALPKLSTVSADRDDNSDAWRRSYRLSDVIFDYTLPNPYGAEPLARRSHGLLAKPRTPPPDGGYGLVLAVNGHGGSAVRQMLPSDDYFWYGDSFARRGYIVLALDISHRPPSDTGGVYEDAPNGDDPAHGNFAHPAIASAGMDSDWAEDGERVWDAMRAIDFLMAQPNVNPSKLIVTGLSMGGEVTEMVGALDDRVTMVIPSGAPPDLSLMGPHYNHPCWQWAHGNATEFVDMSDFMALAAPRQVVLQTGKWDFTYSSYSTPFAADKEAAARARIAFGDEEGNFLHYLHYDGHRYHVGDVSQGHPDPDYIQVPRALTPSSYDQWSDWVVDEETVSLRLTLFDYAAGQTPPPLVARISPR